MNRTFNLNVSNPTISFLKLNSFLLTKHKNATNSAEILFFEQGKNGLFMQWERMQLFVSTLTSSTATVFVK